MYAPTSRNRTGRYAGVLVAVLATMFALAGCSAGGSKAADHSSLTPSATATPAAPAPAPKLGSCHLLSAQQATVATDEKPVVPCRRTHTSVTVYVGQSDPVVDGHMLAVDSATVKQQVAQRCPAAMGRYVGGDASTRRLSRFEVVWFGPTVAQAEAGARWFRCDLVALRASDTLLPLHAGLKGVLNSTSGRDAYATCANAAPGTSRFQQQGHRLCTPKSKWRAVATVDLRGKKYLDKRAEKAAESQCTNEARARASDSLKYSSAFEWPSTQEWQRGQRLGFCWVEAATSS